MTKREKIGAAMALGPIVFTAAWLLGCMLMAQPALGFIMTSVLTVMATGFYLVMVPPEQKAVMEANKKVETYTLGQGYRPNRENNNE